MYSGFEQRLGNKADAEYLLKLALGYCPESFSLWITLARYRLCNGDVDGARKVLSNAFATVGGGGGV